MKPDIAAALLVALGEGPLGRRTLVERTGITESTVRTHLDKLRARGWVSFAKAGTALTEAGRRACAPLLGAVRGPRQVGLEDMGLGAVQVAAHVSGLALPEAAWFLRDRAIQGGASGALVLVCDPRPRFPDAPLPLAQTYAAAAGELERAFPDTAAGDLLLVAFAPHRAAALGGLWRMLVALLAEAGWTLDSRGLARSEAQERKRL